MCLQESTEGGSTQQLALSLSMVKKGVEHKAKRAYIVVQCSISESTVLIDTDEGDQTIQTLFFLAVKQAAKVNKLLVGNVLIIDAHPLSLSAEEVGGIDGACTAAIDGIKALPACKTCLMRSTLQLSVVYQAIPWFSIAC